MSAHASEIIMLLIGTIITGIGYIINRWLSSIDKKFDELADFTKNNANRIDDLEKLTHNLAASDFMTVEGGKAMQATIMKAINKTNHNYITANKEG